MATTTTINTTYAGESAGLYIKPALLSAPSLANGGFTVKQNIKYKEVIKRGDLGALSQDATCDFTPTGTISLTERILEPKEFQVNKTICKKTFRSDWDAMQMGGSIYDNLPKSFSDFIIAYHIEKLQAEIERSLYVGQNAVNGEFTGISQILATDAGLPTGQEVTGTTVDATNVIAELRKIVVAAPTRLYMRPNTKLYVSRNIFQSYIQALGGYGAAGLGSNGMGGQGTMWYNETTPLSVDGVPMFLGMGLADNTAFMTESENIFFGTGLLNDSQQVQVLDMSDIDGSQNVRFVMRYTAGTQIGIIEDCVSYGIPNSAN